LFSESEVSTVDSSKGSDEYSQEEEHVEEDDPKKEDSEEEDSEEEDSEEEDPEYRRRDCLLWGMAESPSGVPTGPLAAGVGEVLGASAADTRPCGAVERGVAGRAADNEGVFGGEGGTK
jgi:hypothetical protein